MKKTLLLLMLCTGWAVAGDIATFDRELMSIKTKTSAETIGVVFNPSEADLEGIEVSVKTLALPATNGPVLIKNLRHIMSRVEAVYLVEGAGVTTPKLAKFVVKNASRHGVAVFTNDHDLSGIEGVTLVRVGEDGTVSVQEQAD